MRKNLLLFGLIFQAFVVFAQRDPNLEILVFFTEGVVKEAKTLNGETVYKASIKNEKLKKKLERIGIRENSLEIANPRFVEADTIKTLGTGKRIH